MKKRLLLILLFGLFTVFLVSCGTNNPDESNSDNIASNVIESETIEKTKTTDVKIIESGYSVSDDYIYYGFVIENSNNDIAFEFPKITITAYDKDSSILSTDTQVMNILLPNETQAFGSILECNGDTPDKVDFTVESGDSITPPSDAISSSQLLITDANERTNDDGDISYTGKVKNDSPNDTDSVGITLLLKNKGKIVYGDTTYVDDLSAGSEKPFDLSEYDLPEHDEFFISAHNWN